jgi:hypothetical protein
MRAANLGLRFLLELVMLAGLAVGGWEIGGVVLAIAAPAAAVVLWALFVAPKASRRLTDPAKVALEIVLFAAATVGWFAAGLAPVAIAFALLVVVNLTLLFAWGQREH